MVAILKKLLFYRVIIFIVVLFSTPLARLFDFTSLPKVYFYAIGIILSIYILNSEISKRIFYKRVEF